MSENQQDEQDSGSVAEEQRPMKKKKKRGPGRPRGKKFTKTIILQVTEEWLAKVDKAAEEDGYKRAAWIRDCCEMLIDET